MDQVELDITNLNSVIGFLHDRGLVGECNLGAGKAYFMTESGRSVLKVVSSLVKEAHRIKVHDFEAISAALSSVDISMIEGKEPMEKVSEVQDFNLDTQERRSKKDFEAYLKSLFNKDPLKIKYKNPDAWYTVNPQDKT
jgi:predicted transcriptional regulator